MYRLSWPRNARDIVNAYFVGFLLFYCLLCAALIHLLWRAHGLWWLCLAVFAHLSLVGYSLARGYQQLRDLIIRIPR